MSYLLALADCRRGIPLADRSVHCCVTSPPYWNLRDYGERGQIGAEPTPDEFVAAMVAVFREVKRVLKDEGTLFLNLGDSYFGGGYSNHRINGESWKSRMNGDKRRSRQQDLKRANPGLKPKDLVGIPWVTALALRADGWYLRSDCIWHKTSGLPESVTDRPSKAHEYVFLLSKSACYHYDDRAVRRPAAKSSRARLAQDVAAQAGSERANAGAKANGPMKAVGDPETASLDTVWSIPAYSAFRGGHFAVMPPRLAQTCILAGCPVGGTVLDPFNGSGTTGVVALAHGRRYVGLDLSPKYIAMAKRRIDRPHASLKVERPGVALPLFDANV